MGGRSGHALVGSLRGTGSGTCAWFRHGTGETRLCSLVSKDRSYKPMVKSSGAQWESDGVVVPRIAVSNAAGGKGPDFGHASGGGKHGGMAGIARSNNPGGQPRPVDAEARLVPRLVKVRELQRKLWAAAKQSEGRRFHALYDRIYRDDVLVEAWERVRANRGAAGVDRMTLGAVEVYGVDRMLRELRDDLRAGTYRSSPVRRVEILKPDGRRRPLVTSTRGTYSRPWSSVRKNLVAAVVSRREVTRMSSTVPFWSTPQVVGLPTDRDEYLIEVPSVPWAWPAAAQPVGVGLPELGIPLPHRLVGDHDAPFQHHLLHLTQAQWEPVVEPDTVTDDLRRVAKPLVGRRLVPHQPQPLPPHCEQPGDPPSHKAGNQVDNAPTPPNEPEDQSEGLSS
jgi:hypothetical protein